MANLISKQRNKDENKDLVVEDLVEDLPPWRIVLPRWRSKSVIELKSGFINKYQIKKGDQLDVVS